MNFLYSISRAKSSKLGKHLILTKNGTFLKKKKKGSKNFTSPFSVPFLNVLLQNKAYHNFHKKVWGLIAGRIKDLD